MTDTPEQSEPKSVTGIFAAVYRAFDEAGKLAMDESIGDKTANLREALNGIPQADLDALVQNVVGTYKNLEGMHVTGIGFEPFEGSIRCMVSVKFGTADVTMSCPYEIDGALQVMKSLDDSIRILKPINLILPN